MQQFFWMCLNTQVCTAVCWSLQWFLIGAENKSRCRKQVNVHASCAPISRCVCGFHPLAVHSQQQQTDFYDVPATVKEYIQEVKEQLCMFMDWPEAGVSAEEKLSFFRETRHAYGRTALLFSGGGGLGCFHIVSGASRCRARAPIGTAYSGSRQRTLPLVIGRLACKSHTVL